MQYIITEEQHQLILTEGFKDALLVAEEIYLVDISHGEPTFQKLNPSTHHTIKMSLTYPDYMSSTVPVYA